MRKLTILVTFLFILKVQSQNLTFSDLLRVIEMPNPDQVTLLISDKSSDWEFYESEENSYAGENITWTYLRSYNTDLANGFLTVYYSENQPQKVWLQTLGIDVFNSITRDFKKYGFKFIKRKTYENSIDTYYENSKFELNVESSTNSESEYYTGDKYIITLKRIRGSYDYGNGLKKYYHSNGGISAVYYLNNYKKEGNYKSYYMNGKLKINCFYKNNQLTGQHKEYDSNGNLVISVEYKNGKLNGLYKKWNSDGYLINSGFYRDDKKEGKWKEDWEFQEYSWEYKRITFYKRDIEHGLKTSYYENGKVRKTENYENGKLSGVVKTYSEDGLITEIINKYVNGKIHGYRLRYNYVNNKKIRTDSSSYISGNREYRFRIGYDNIYYEIFNLKEFKKKDQLITSEEYWDQNQESELLNLKVYHSETENYDTLSSKLFFTFNGRESGGLSGLWKFYNQIGLIDSFGYMTISNDDIQEKNGLWKYFYSNGKPKYYYTYQKNKFNGSCKEWDSNGKLIKSGDYLNGKLNGRWDYYKQNGDHIISNYYLGIKVGEQLKYINFENREILVEKINIENKSKNTIYKVGKDPIMYNLFSFYSELYSCKNKLDQTYYIDLLNGEIKVYHGVNNSETILDTSDLRICFHAIGTYDENTHKFNGQFKFQSANGKIMCYGNGQLFINNRFTFGEPLGIWHYYYHNQGIHIIENHGLKMSENSETYYNISDDKLYKGQFILIDKGKKVISNIKKGKLHGESVSYDVNTNTEISRAIYKKGILKK